MPSYANETGQNQGNRDKFPINTKSIEETKKITSTILTALVSSHYFESIEPGSFQRAMDKTLEANGLPRVIIPIYEILQDYEKAITKIISDMREKQQKDNGDDGEEDMEEGYIDSDDINYSQKRTRNCDSSPTENQGKKAKEDTIFENRIQKAVSLESMHDPGRPLLSQQHSQHKTQGDKQPQQQTTRQQLPKQQTHQNLKSQASALPQQKRESLGRTTQTKSRDLGMIIYIREREQIDLRDIYEDEAEEKREHIARMVMNKRAVVHWTDNKLKAEHVREMFDKRQLSLLDIKYVGVSDSIFKTLKTEVVARQTKKK